jgi:hypothetical protein
MTTNTSRPASGTPEGPCPMSITTAQLRVVADWLDHHQLPHANPGFGSVSISFTTNTIADFIAYARALGITAIRVTRHSDGTRAYLHPSSNGDPTPGLFGAAWTHLGMIADAVPDGITLDDHGIALVTLDTLAAVTR